MSNTEQKQPKFSVVIQQENYQKLINDTLGDKETAKRFVAEITSVVANNYTLQKCTSNTIIAGGLLAQSLKLPLAASLGFCALVPYKNGDYTNAQFQIMWKGLIQLAQRTGLYETIGVRPVHKGEYAGQNEFGEDEFKFSHEYDLEEVVGYFAYFKLTNGFKKTLYWTKEQCEAHGHKYSKCYNAQWGSNFDAMASKTVLKQLISKYGPMSVDIQKAVQYDQAIVNDDGSANYVDNPSNELEELNATNNAIEESEPDIE